MQQQHPITPRMRHLPTKIDLALGAGAHLGGLQPQPPPRVEVADAEQIKQAELDVDLEAASKLSKSMEQLRAQLQTFLATQINSRLRDAEEGEGERDKEVLVVMEMLMRLAAALQLAGTAAATFWLYLS